MILVGWKLEQGSHTLESRVLDTEGRSVGAADLRLVRRIPSPTAGIENLVTRLRTRGVAPGDYTLEVTLRGDRPGAAPLSVRTRIHVAAP